jgi:transposase
MFVQKNIHLKHVVDVGRNEIFNCNMCFLNIDRDVNGSRNILIKQLV